jgi:hypothetical protein
MARKVFVGFRVARPRGMMLLPGVDNSVDEMASRARIQVYHAVSLTDAREAVTAGRIRAELEPCSPPYASSCWR